MNVYVVLTSGGRQLGRLLAANTERALAQADRSFKQYLAPG